MKINKKVKIALWSVLGFSLLMFAILVYHIATARPIDNATIQVSRIDFDKPFDSITSVAVQQQLHEIQGVKTEIIVKRNVVVYFHDNRIADSKKIYEELMTKGHYNAQRFLIPEALANKQVCPVMKKDDISYKFTKFVQGVFH